MLPKKRLGLGLAIGGACVIALFLVTNRSHPEKLIYKGRSLDVWSQQAVQSDTNAAAMFRELGVRAVPGLIISLTNDEPFLRQKKSSSKNSIKSRKANRGI